MRRRDRDRTSPRSPAWARLVRLRAMRRAAALALAACPLRRLSPAAAAARRSRRRPRRSRARCPRRRPGRPPRRRRRSTLEGDAAAGEQVFASAGCGGCHTLSAAGATGTVGPNLDDAQAGRRARGRARHARPGRHAVVQRSARAAADRRRRRVRRPVDRRLILPADFPRRGRGVRLRPRRHADRARTACCGRGRSPRSRAVRGAGIPVLSRPAGCSARSRPTSGGRDRRSRWSATRVPPSSIRVTGEFLLHEPLALDVAREAIAARRRTHGFSPNCYVDDELYVAERPSTRARTPTSSASRSPRSATCSPGSSGRRRSSSPSPTRLCSTASGRSSTAVRRAPLHHEVAAVFPRARAARRDEGNRARVRRRAARASTSRRRSRSATARTTSSCSTGRLSASPSRTATSG